MSEKILPFKVLVSESGDLIRYDSDINDFIESELPELFPDYVTIEDLQGVLSSNQEKVTLMQCRLIIG